MPKFSKPVLEPTTQAFIDALEAKGANRCTPSPMRTRAVSEKLSGALGTKSGRARGSLMHRICTTKKENKHENSAGANLTRPTRQYRA